VRNIVFRFDDAGSFASSLDEAEQELVLPPGESVGDGEWVLAIFEMGEPPRATAAAARGLHRGPGASPVLLFERRDWARLLDFAEASSASLRLLVPAAPSSEIPPEPPTEPCLFQLDAEPPPSSESPCEGSFMLGTGARVLLVDDDADICDVVGAMLATVGLTVEAAPTAEEALERVREREYDLVVLDRNLPGMTGIELCRLIRKDPRLAVLPVLFLTAHATSRDVVEAFSCGADDYVAKPFRAPELGARIFGLLRRARMAPLPT
jgi:two-component system phosphate regulon response regulator PhoB